MGSTPSTQAAGDTATPPHEITTTATNKNSNETKEQRPTTTSKRNRRNQTAQQPSSYPTHLALPHLPSLDDSMDGAGLGLSQPDRGEGLGLSQPPSSSSSSSPSPPPPRPIRDPPLGIGVGVAVVACATCDVRPRRGLREKKSPVCVCGGVTKTCRKRYTARGIQETTQIFFRGRCWRFRV